MTTPRQWMQTLRGLPQQLLQHLSPRQRRVRHARCPDGRRCRVYSSRYAFTASTPSPSTTQPAAGPASSVTNIGVMSPGAQVNPVDQSFAWPAQACPVRERTRRTGTTQQGSPDLRSENDAALCRTGTATDFDPTSRCDASASHASPDHATSSEPAPRAATVQGLVRRSNAEWHARRSANTEPTDGANASDYPDYRGRARPPRQHRRKLSVHQELDRQHPPEPYPPSCPSALPAARCWAVWMRRPAGNQSIRTRS